VARDCVDQKHKIDPERAWLRKFQFRNEAIGMCCHLTYRFPRGCCCDFNLIALWCGERMLYLQCGSQPSRRKPANRVELVREMLRAEESGPHSPGNARRRERI